MERIKGNGVTSVTGHAPAMNNLAHVLEEMSQFAQALYWYKKAAKQGHKGAKKRLTAM